MSVISYGNVTVTNINDGVDGTDGQMLYATCSTAANVATKVATLASGTLTLTAGTTVAITFTYTNTAENPTLNVSSTGNIAIYAGNVNLPDIYNWQAGDTVVFIYDGTNWQITNTSNNDRTVYKAEVTANEPIPAATIGVFGSDGKIKKLTASSAFDLSMPILYIGTAYEANKLTQTNNYTFWGTPFDLTATHSISSATSGKPVYIEGTISGNMFTPTSTVLTCNTSQTTSSYYYLRLGLMNTQTTAILQSEHPLYSYIQNVFQRVDKGAATIATATQQYFWHAQGGTDAGAHITEIPKNDFLADPTHGGGNLLAKSNGIAVRDGLAELATFGANGSTIGDTDKTHLILDYHSLQGVSKEGTYFFVSDLRNDEGLATIPERFEPNLPDNTYSLYYTAVDLVSVTVNGTELDTSKYSISDNVVTITNVTLNADDVIIISYTTKSSKATAYTFGSRNPSATVGGMSVAYGNNVEASGVASFAGGINTLAADRYAFAIGNACEATGWASYAGGLGSKATKSRSVAYGYHCESNGYDSVALGHNTKNSTDHSLAIGHWNKPGNYAFSIGNGTSENNRSNAVEIDYNGNWGVHGNEIPDQTNTRYLGNGTYRWQNVYSHYLDASANITAGAVKSITPTWASGQNPANYHCVVSAGICSFSYQGQGVAHSANASIGTLPSGARPTSELYVPFVKMAGGVIGVIRITTAGAITVNQISSTTNTGRIYFNCSFPVV